MRHRQITSLAALVFIAGHGCAAPPPEDGWANEQIYAAPDGGAGDGGDAGDAGDAGDGGDGGCDSGTCCEPAPDRPAPAAYVDYINTLAHNQEEGSPVPGTTGESMSCNDLREYWRRSGTGGATLELKILGIGFSAGFEVETRREKWSGYRVCSEYDDFDDCNVLTAPAEVTCYRSCISQLSWTAHGNASVIAKGGGSVEEGMRDQRSASRKFTVPAGTPLNNISAMCDRAFAGGPSHDDLCEAAERWIEAHTELVLDEGNCTSDAECEAREELPSVDAWTNARCIAYNTDDVCRMYTQCRDFSIRGGNCSGEGSSGLFEYPCDTGLTCTLVSSCSAWDRFWGNCVYECR